MNWRLAGVLALSISCSGCVTERQGVDFAAMAQKIGPPKAGQARIVVFREKAFAGIIDQGWKVKLDDVEMGDMKTGTYVYADRPAGRHQLTYTEPLFPGVTQRDMTVSAGRTYFFLTRVSERAKQINGMAAVGGLSGVIIMSAVTAGDQNPGPVEFFPLEETAAREALADLRLAE